MRKCLIAAVCGSLYLASATSLPQNAAAEMKQPTIQVTGVGTVPVKPDIAIVNLGVTNEDADVQSAFTANNAATKKILTELEATGIASNDVQTYNFSINPQPRIGENKQTGTIYRVTNTVKVKIRNLEKLPAILGKVVAAGSNSITGLGFSVSNPDTYVAEARKKAIANARERAETLAKAAGVALGSMVSLVEGGGGASYRKGFIGGAADAAVPIEAGEESVQAIVVVQFEIKPGKPE
jgi:uncharacterized protein YggE